MLKLFYGAFAVTLLVLYNRFGLDVKWLIYGLIVLLILVIASAADLQGNQND
jgi:hypothetical protein